MDETPIVKYTFEDKIESIDREIERRRYRWRLKAIPSIDFEDVSQIVRIHIYKKWDMWNQERPLEPWLSTVITHQIRNLLRNNWGAISRPCLRCAANQGGDLCSLYQTQCSACPLFAHWEKTKKRAHDIKMPLPIEHHKQEIYDMPDANFDIEKSAEKIHGLMEKKLKPVEWKIYQFLYIEGKSEEEVAKLMGYNATEENRNARYKRIKQIQKVIMVKVKKVIEEHGV